MTPRPGTRDFPVPGPLRRECHTTQQSSFATLQTSQLYSFTTISTPLKLHQRPNRTFLKMFARAAARATPRTTQAVVARRGFHATRSQLSSPYHYPEGPYSNIPFNPKTKFFAVRYWSFMAVGFSAPFLIAIYQTYKPRN